MSPAAGAAIDLLGVGVALCGVYTCGLVGVLSIRRGRRWAHAHLPGTRVLVLVAGAVVQLLGAPDLAAADAREVVASPGAGPTDAPPSRATMAGLHPGSNERERSPATARMTRLDGPVSAADDLPDPDERDGAGAHRPDLDGLDGLDGAIVPGSTAAPRDDHADHGPSSRPAAPAAEPDEHETWQVRAGDHLWHIADATVAEREPGGDVASYWRELVAANVDVLVDPANPDLILPGQLLTLPGAVS